MKIFFTGKRYCQSKEYQSI